jgi:hypothetical protein
MEGTMPDTLLPFLDGGYAFIKGGLPYCQLGVHGPHYVPSNCARRSLSA